MKSILPLVALVLVLGAVGYWLRGGDPEPEVVAFAPFQVEAFSDGGTLTDAWADFDGDGDPDRFVGFNGQPSRLYRNDGTDGFIDVASEVGLVVERAVRTTAWGDFDSDGDPDLLLGYAGDAPVTALFRNDGNDGFSEVAEATGVALSAGVTRQASWVDYDGDGDLDLYLAMRDGPNRLFRNDGGSEVASDSGPRFADVTEASGIGDPRRSVGAFWLDFDRDGDLDVVVGNMDGDANGLWMNDGGAFEDVAGGSPVAGGGRALADEGAGTVRPCGADVNRDGFFDVYFANYGPNQLLLGGEDGGWTAAPSEWAVGTTLMDDSCLWGDFDHDGWLDLFVNGTVTGGVQYRDHLLRREGGDTFVDVTPEEWLPLESDHAATWIDADMDGDLDLALTGAPENGQHLLMRNLLRPEFARHSLQVRVLDENGRATRAGAEVYVYAAGTDRLVGAGFVDTGSGYDSQSDLPVHFGLPGAQPVDIEVVFPAGGTRQTTRVEGVDPTEHIGRSFEVRTR